MKKNIKRQTASKCKKETKQDFAFYLGIDLRDKHSDVCVFWIKAAKSSSSSACG